MEYTNSGDDKEGDIESRDDNEVNKINIITNYHGGKRRKTRYRLKTSERNDLESETFIARETKRERDIAL